MNSPIPANAWITGRRVHDLLARHPHHDAVQLDVLTPGELRVEAGAQFQERRDSPVHDDPPFRRRHDSGNHLQQRALARSVVADEAERGARGDTQRHVGQRPEVGVIASSSRTSSSPALDDGESDTAGRPSRRGRPRSRVRTSEQIGEGRLRSHEQPMPGHEHGERDDGEQREGDEGRHSIVEQRAAIGVDDCASSG